MGRDLVQIEFKMPNYLERYRTKFDQILRGIAADIQTNVGLRFENQGQYNGHERWKDLASGANLKKSKNGLSSRQVLKKTGALSQSMGPKNPSGQPGPSGYVKFEGTPSQAIVRVGTTLKYARIHNEGGTINHPGTKNGFGRGIKIKAHKIQMPRRNWTDWNNADKSNMKNYLKNLVDVLSGR